jgi:hypothetical protein
MDFKKEKDDKRQLIAFATFLSGALTVSDNGQYQVYGNSEGTPLAITGLLLGNEQANTSKPPICSIPSLLIHQPCGGLRRNLDTKTALANIAATNLGIPETMRGFDIVQLPRIALCNIHSSFLYLVQARLKSTVDVLGQQRTTIENQRSHIMVDLLLPMASPIKINNVVTTFHAQPSVEGNRQENDSVLTLLFEATIDCKVLGQIVPARLSTPGTIQGLFVEERLDTIEISLDTTSLLNCMMQEARRIVRRAVLIATQVAACVTKALPCNAPSNLVETSQSLLHNYCKGMSKSEFVNQDKRERHAVHKQQRNEEDSSKSTYIPEESLLMPPPPVRLPRSLPSQLTPSLSITIPDSSAEVAEGPSCCTSTRKS